MNVITKISCYLERSVVTLKSRKEYLNTVTYNNSSFLTSILLWTKKLNSLIYRTLFYVNMYGSYKLSKTVRFLAHPVLLIYVIFSFMLQYIVLLTRPIETHVIAMSMVGWVVGG